MKYQPGPSRTSGDGVTYWGALFPAFAARMHQGPKVLGLFYAAPYAGSLLVTLLSGRVKHVRRQGLAVETSVVIWGVAIVAFGLSRSLWTALLSLAVAGGADMWSGIFRTSIGQAITPDEMRGRMSGIELAVVATGPTLGNLEAGVVPQQLGPVLALLRPNHPIARS